MNFKEKLQKIRKEKGYSQEQLADMIGVSRQAVSKWESGLSYPETEKLIELSKLFSLSLDELLKDEIKEEAPLIDPILETDFLKFYKKFSFMIALGVCLCIAGLVATAIVEELIQNQLFEIITFFSFVLVAVVIFVYYGMEYEQYEEVEKQYRKKMKHKVIPRSVQKKFSISITLGVALCILGIVFGGIANEMTERNSIIAIFFFTPVAIAVWLFIYYGMAYGMYQEKTKKKDNVTEKIHGVIMLVATLIFLLFGFLSNAWHPAWVVFPIGGILCGIVSILTNED